MTECFGGPKSWLHYNHTRILRSTIFCFWFLFSPFSSQSSVSSIRVFVLFSEWTAGDRTSHIARTLYNDAINSHPFFYCIFCLRFSVHSNKFFFDSATVFHIPLLCQREMWRFIKFTISLFAHNKKWSENKRNKENLLHVFCVVRSDLRPYLECSFVFFSIFFPAGLIPSFIVNFGIFFQYDRTNSTDKRFLCMETTTFI